MSAPLVPSPLDYVGRRRFAFYPPVKNAEPNQWLLAGGSWSEVQAVNAQTGCELWIPRQYIGGVSGGNASLLIVELKKELEFRSGAVEPRARRIIQMPDTQMPNVAKRPEAPSDADTRSGPAPVVGIRLEDRAESTMSKAVVTLGIGAFGVWLLAVLLSALEHM
jgi:hypothetical protein